jgi:glycosyltransferase involved in cell wall biosynthesis
VRLWDLSDLPRIEDAPGNLTPFIPRYREAIDALAHSARAPVILSPNLLGDSYAIAAALSQVLPDRLRVVGWLHNDIPYEYHVQSHYEPLIAAFIPVSRTIEATLASKLGAHRAHDIRTIAHGIEVPPAPPPREPVTGRALRLVYSGRLDESQKRVLCLPELSRELTRRGLHHELVILGDGPAAADLARASAGIDHLRLCGPVDASRVAAVLERADILVLPSRHEGLSVAVMEAMARACVPVITALASGAAELVQDTISGVLVNAPSDAAPTALALAMADGVMRASRPPPAMSIAAHQRARQHFSLSRHVEEVIILLHAVAQAPPRPWPTNRPCAFGGSGAAPSGSVPADGAARLAATLQSLAGRRVLIHGTGRHTLELAEIFAAHGACIVAFTDDDPAKHGTTLWGWEVVAPTEANGCTDVVISSWINQDAILTRRAMYQSQGLAVHAIYQPRADACPQAEGLIASSRG